MFDDCVGDDEVAADDEIGGRVIGDGFCVEGVDEIFDMAIIPATTTTKANTPNAILF
jgi:hypothetical protein